MKKTITLIMLVAAILIGGASVDAKTTKKKSKAKTTTSKKSSKPAGAIALVNLSNGGKLYLMNNGNVKVSPASWDQDGYYVKSNGAYIMNWGSGTYGDNKISVVYGNTMYDVIVTDYDNNEFWSYYWDHDSNLAQCASFDSGSQTVTLKTTDGSKRISLSSVSSSDRRSVTWY